MGGLGNILIQLMFLFQTVGKPAAFVLSVISTLNTQVSQEAQVSAALAHRSASVDRMIKGAGNWAGFVFLLWCRHMDEAIQALSRHATRLPTRQGRPKSLICSEICGRLVWLL